MFTPLSKGSERAQDKLWDQGKSPGRTATRPSLAAIASSSSLRPAEQLSGRAGLPISPALSPIAGFASPVRRSQARHTVTGVEEARSHDWLRLFFRPTRAEVDRWLSSFWKRHFVLVLLPCLAVWFWVAIPFPVSDPYTRDPFPEIPRWPHKPRTPSEEHDPTSPADGEDLPIDVNFYFFLTWYYGMYLAVALFFITNLFSLYRLNWWPSALGGKVSYALNWSAVLALGLAAHDLDLFHLRNRWQNRDPQDEVDWERKTFWVLLSFVAMLMPALACFSKLKRDKRHKYRHAEPPVARTFLEQGFGKRIPASWLRFLWFMTCLGIACFALIAGQAYASLFLSTLPHTSLDAGTWVWSWVITVTLLSQCSMFILGSKVRSRALLFLYKLFFQLVYHAFYRNLFARLRSPSQFATVQLLSSALVVVMFPLQMTRLWHRALQVVTGYPQPYEEHVESIASGFYVRGLAQNISMVGFLGWLTILHFGPNRQVYPFFRFQETPEDPYTFHMTFIASSVIWAVELLSSFVARQCMRMAFKIDVSQVGLDEMREYPELVPACGWASVHVSMNILLFLIKLNFR